MKQYNEDFREIVLATYKENSNMALTARQFNISLYTVRNWVHGIGRVCAGQKTINEILERYNKGQYLEQIANDFGKSRGWVAKIIRDNHGTIRHKGPQCRILHQDYFHNIDSEKKAYYLGWIMADGNVSFHNGQYALKLGVQKSDRYLIDSFLADIQSEHKPHLRNNNKGSQFVYVSIGCKQMVQDLIVLGVIPRKSGHETLPNISPSLISHFYRGYFDGDGMASCKNKKKRSGFIGPKDILEPLQYILGTNVKYHKAKCNIDIYNMHYGVKDSKNCTIFFILMLLYGFIEKDK